MAVTNAMRTALATAMAVNIGQLRAAVETATRNLATAQAAYDAAYAAVESTNANPLSVAYDNLINALYDAKVALDAAGVAKGDADVALQTAIDNRRIALDNFIAGKRAG